jgi:hypothetical protein
MKRGELAAVTALRSRLHWTCLALFAGLVATCQLRDDVIATRLERLGDGGSLANGGAGTANGGAGTANGGAGTANGGAGTANGGAGTANGDAGTANGDAGSAGASNEICANFVPTLMTAVGDGRLEETCAGWTARRAFSHAICSCGDLEVAAVLASNALDSSTGAEEDERSGASVGVNGDYGGGEYVRVGGSLTVLGTAPVESRGGIDVAGDLRLVAPATASGPIFVGRDAWLLGTTSSASLATVGRNLHLGPNGSLGTPAVVAGETVRGPFELPPACACADDELIDIAGIVGQGMTLNDNGRLGVSLDALRDVVSPTQITLSCGRFAFGEISGDAAIELRISGRVLLFVDGDVAAGRRFSLELEPGAALDWFISGSLSMSPESLIGDNTRLGAVRIYVLGADTIALPGTARFSANLYAPRAPLTVGLLGSVYGAAFGATITSQGPLLARYDRSVLRADDDCGLSPPTRCNACDQCSTGKACVGGVCTACVTDADCCFPLACEAGACQPLSGN